MGKYLGQHFLTSRDKLREIAEALELKNGDVIIEIGPGRGELTSEIVSKFQSLKVDKFKLVAIEKDEKLAKNLELRIKNLGLKNIEIIHGDALKILPKISKTQNLKPNTYKVVGNIPYYITGYLLRILGELENKPLLIVLTIQKEVAERICAQPSKMNLLAASVQFWAKPEIIGCISKKDFQPMPKVDSAIITLTPIAADNKQIGANKYYSLIKALFKQPRKTILNNLEYRIKNLELRAKNKQKLKEKLLKIGINPGERPQDLSIKQIKELSTLF